jgi:hypothetical protein
MFLIYEEDIRTSYKSNRTSYKFAANLIRKKFATCEIEIESGQSSVRFDSFGALVSPPLGFGFGLAHSLLQYRRYRFHPRDSSTECSMEMQHH